MFCVRLERVQGDVIVDARASKQKELPLSIGRLLPPPYLLR